MMMESSKSDGMKTAAALDSHASVDPWDVDMRDNMELMSSVISWGTTI